MEKSDRLLKRIADLFLAFVAFIGLIGIKEKFQLNITAILTISGIILFIAFIALITHHSSKLEEKIIKLEDCLNNEKRFAKIESKLINIEDKLNKK